MKISRLLSVVFAAGVVAGCKMVVIVPPGGEVRSTNGFFICGAARLCPIELTQVALPFSQSFKATAQPGYQFVKWQGDGSHGFLCADSSNPTCTITVPSTPVGEAIRASFETAYLMPVFKDVGFDTDGDGTFDRVDTDDDNDGVLDVDDQCPLTGPNSNGFGCPVFTRVPPDSVDVNGRLWKQVYAFGNVDLSWAQISAVCPGGACNGQLNGVDLTGWKWANSNEVKAQIVNSYLFPDQCSDFYAVWDPQIYSHPTDPQYERNGESFVWGFTSDVLSYPATIGVANSGPPPCGVIPDAGSLDLFLWFYPGAKIGGWFYRP